MRIRRLVLDNVRCFRHLDLSFERDGKARSWTFVVGPNGMGKTTVLRALGSAFGDDPVRGGRRLGARSLRHGALSGDIRLVVDHPGLAARAEFHLPIDREGHALSLTLPKGWGRPTALILGFGPTRLGGSSVIEPGVASDRPSEERAIDGSLTALYEWPVDRLNQLYQWVRWEEFIRLKSAHGPVHRPAALLQLAGALNILFEGVATFLDVDSRGQILFDTEDGPIALEDLADGLRSVFVVVAELVLRLDAAFPESKAPLQEPAVCLIDELDAHLHPRLQRTVVPTLRTLFPNVQFIVTTHSPYVVGAAEPGEIVVLRRTPDGVVADLDVPDVTGWTADQIATSSIFGLDTTRDLRGEEALRTERELLGKQKLSPPEQQALDHARAVLDHADGPATAMVRRLLSLTGDPNTKARPASPKSRNRHTSRTRKTGKELERSAPRATSVEKPPAKASKKAPKKKAR